MMTNVKWYMILLFGFSLSQVFADTLAKEDLIAQCKYNLQAGYDRISMKVSVDNRSPTAEENSDHIRKRDYIYHKDGQRVEWLGTVSLFDASGNQIPGNETCLLRNIFDGKQYVDLMLINPDSVFKTHRAVITTNYQQSFNLLSKHPLFGGPLFGRIYGNESNGIDNFLNQYSFDILPAQEKIRDMLCRVLHAKTTYGDVTIWVNPAMNNVIVKWIIEKKESDLYDKEPLSALKLKAWVALYEAEDFFNVGEFFYPHKVLFSKKTVDTKGKIDENQYKYQVSDIQFDPNFEALGAFKINLPEGTRVDSKDFPGVIWRWQNGKLVAWVDQSFLDVLDGEIKQIKSGWEPNLSTPAKTEEPPLAVNKHNITETDDAKQSNADSTMPLANEEEPNYATIVIIGILVIFIAGTIIYKLRRKQANV